MFKPASLTPPTPELHLKAFELFSSYLILTRSLAKAIADVMDFSQGAEIRISNKNGSGCRME